MKETNNKNKTIFKRKITYDIMKESNSSEFLFRNESEQEKKNA